MCLAGKKALDPKTKGNESVYNLRYRGTGGAMKEMARGKKLMVVRQGGTLGNSNLGHTRSLGEVKSAVGLKKAWRHTVDSDAGSLCKR